MASLHELISGAFEAMPALQELSADEEVARQVRVAYYRAKAPKSVPTKLKDGFVRWMWKHLELDFISRGLEPDFDEGELYMDGSLQPLFFLAFERMMRSLFRKFSACREDEESKIVKYREELVERVIDHPSSTGFLIPDTHRKALFHILFVKSMPLPHDTGDHPVQLLTQAWQEGASATLDTLLKSGGSSYDKICSLDFYNVAPGGWGCEYLARDRCSVVAVSEVSDGDDNDTVGDGDDNDTEGDGDDNDTEDDDSSCSQSDYGGDSEPEEHESDYLRHQKPDFRELKRSIWTLRSSTLNAKERATKDDHSELGVMKLLVEFYADYLSYANHHAYNMFHIVADFGNWV